MKLIEQEREQLLAHWTRVFRRNPCWFTSPPPQLTSVLSPNTPDRGMAVRKFHDKVGFCAKGRVQTGGLCAGTIFRTAAFIDLPQEARSGARPRSGASLPTIHIEHTVPANVLARELASKVDAGASLEVGLAWLLKHSVTTAMKKGQDADFLKGVTRTTTAFNLCPEEAEKPFKRYSKLFAAKERVWDVWNRSEIDPDEMTFVLHFETVLSILHEAGADKAFIKKLEAAGRGL